MDHHRRWPLHNPQSFLAAHLGFIAWDWDQMLVVRHRQRIAIVWITRGHWLNHYGVRLPDNHHLESPKRRYPGDRNTITWRNWGVIALERLIDII